MGVAEWGVVIGVATPALLAFGPWMFMVHAKLAVLSAQVARLDAKVDKLGDAQQERLTWCVQHQAALDEFARRLEQHDAQLEHVQGRG
jgi:outer membrane murein-binding lipoprotein Lpp